MVTAGWLLLFALHQIINQLYLLWGRRAGEAKNGPFRTKNMFYKQIILQRGLPFEVKIPDRTPTDISMLGIEELLWRIRQSSHQCWQGESNLRKMTISRVENACKPLILPGLQKKFKKISTHLLTVLTITAIFLLEHENQVVSADLLSLPDQSYGSEW